MVRLLTNERCLWSRRSFLKFDFHLFRVSLLFQICTRLSVGDQTFLHLYHANCHFRRYWQIITVVLPRVSNAFGTTRHVSIFRLVLESHCSRSTNVISSEQVMHALPDTFFAQVIKVIACLLIRLTLRGSACLVLYGIARPKKAAIQLILSKWNRLNLTALFNLVALFFREKLFEGGVYVSALLDGLNCVRLYF